PIATSAAAKAVTTAATEPPPGADVSAATVARSSSTVWLEKPNRAAVFVNIDVEGGGSGTEAGHRLHVSEERHEPACARISADVTHGDGEALRRVQEQGVGREREMG